MKLKIKIYLFIIAISFLFQTAFSQDTVSNELNYNDFIAMVISHHPLIKQAELINQKGELNLKKARGAFDPYLYNYFSDKQYDSKKYYSLLDGGLKVPTWFGLEGKFAYENNTGYNLSPENSTPPAGLAVAGVSMPLAKGLFFDQRRNQLKQAKIFNEMSEYEQFMEINKILFDATKNYWDWVIAYNQMQIYKNSIVLANIRFKGVKENFREGAQPAIDTLEAFIQYQDRIFSFNDAQLKLKEEELNLSVFLWTEDLVPLELDSAITAPEILIRTRNLIEIEKDLNSILEFDIEEHPIYKTYDLKLQSLNFERRYKLENLKPKINVNYNFLTEPINDNFYSTFSRENYKLGVEFQMPLFLRKERAEFKLSNVKIQETKFEQSVKLRQLKNKIDFYYLELSNLERQEQLYTVNTLNYGKLLDAEIRKFDIGESSIFLINSRENKLIDAKIKLINIRGKYQKSFASLLFSLGQQIAN